jgi:hypothetical protein
MAVPSVAEPAEHLVDFLVYVMPGFIALQLFRAKYPAKKVSEFLQVAWSLIYGVILATLVRGVDGRFLRGRLQSNTPGFPASRFVASSCPSWLVRRNPPGRNVFRALFPCGALASPGGNRARSTVDLGQGESTIQRLRGCLCGRRLDLLWLD